MLCGMYSFVAQTCTVLVQYLSNFYTEQALISINLSITNSY